MDTLGVRGFFLMAWGPVRGRRFVLPLGKGYDEVSEFADVTGVRKVRDVSAEVQAGLAREVTWEVAPDYFLHYGLDAPTGRSFAQISGEEVDQVDEFNEIISEYFEVSDDDDLLNAVDMATSQDELRTALIVLGMGAPTSIDQRFLERLENATQAENPRVREAALWGVAYALWPPLMQSIQRMAEEDPDELVRVQARALAEFLRKGGESS